MHPRRPGLAWWRPPEAPGGGRNPLLFTSPLLSRRPGGLFEHSKKINLVSCCISNDFFAQKLLGGLDFFCFVVNLFSFDMWIIPALLAQISGDLNRLSPDGHREKKTEPALVIFYTHFRKKHFSYSEKSCDALNADPKIFVKL